MEPALTVFPMPPPRVNSPSKVVRGKVQPPTLPSADRPGRVTNQLLYIKRKVMPAVWAHKFTWPFKKPVDAVKLNLPDYHTIIKHPMDFGTIRKRLMTKYYWSASECHEDIKLVFSNCFIYNKPELDISIMGRTLEKHCESLMERMPQPELDQESTKTAGKRKGRPVGDSRSHRKRSHCGGEQSVKKARTSVTCGLESDTPSVRVGSVEGDSTKSHTASEESDSEDEEETGSESDTEGKETGRAPGARPSNHRPVPVPRTFQDERPGGLLTERKTIKNYCKYCDQAFLSKYVRDMHEKVKHGSGYVSAEKPKKMPVIKKPRKEAKSLQIVAVKTEPALSLSPPVTQSPSSRGSETTTSQFTDQDLLNFVDKKHQAMNKQAKKNQTVPPCKKEPGVVSPPVTNMNIPEDMLFPVPEELLLKEGYMHNSSAPPSGFSQVTTNGPVPNGSPAPQTQTPPVRPPGLCGGQTRGAVRPQRPLRAPRTGRVSPPVSQPSASPPTSKYDLHTELGFMEPTFTKSALGTVTVSGPQTHYLGPVVHHSGPTQEALMMARNAMRGPGPSQPQSFSHRSSFAYSPEVHTVPRTSIEERSPGPFLTQQRPAVIRENSFHQAGQTAKPACSSSQPSPASYGSPEPVPHSPRPVSLESRSVIFPSKPLPKEALKEVQVMQPTPAPAPFTINKPIDVLAQTLQLSEIDGFDFTEEKDMPGLVSTQELTLGDLKHLRTETVTIPNSQTRSGQMKQSPIGNGQDKLEDLLDFSNITYQDVRQLIGPADNMIVYPESDGSFAEALSAGAQPTVMLQAQSLPRVTYSTSQSFRLQSPSLTSQSSMASFTTDLVYPDMVSLEPATVYSVPEEKSKREEKWWIG